MSRSLVKYLIVRVGLAIIIALIHLAIRISMLVTLYMFTNPTNLIVAIMSS
jgi:hypothetical protein